MKSKRFITVKGFQGLAMLAKCDMGNTIHYKDADEVLNESIKAAYKAGVHDAVDALREMANGKLTPEEVCNLLLGKEAQ